MAQKLAADEFNLILGYNANDDAALASKANLESRYGVQIYTVKGDVAEEATITAIFECVEKHFGGKLHAFVHNAGLYLGFTTKPESDQAKKAAGYPTGHLDGNFAQWDYYQNVYPKCFLKCVAKCMEYMEDGKGRIVAISTPGCNVCQTPRPGSFITGQAKASMEFFVRYMALRLAERRISVNCVIPGYVKTDAWEALRQSEKSTDPDDVAIKRTPMKMWGDPSDIGEAVAFLCSPKASFITGTALPVDGGLHLK
ncbi:enoyl-[acyl-carrier-protein] reductase [NADPH] FabL-like [Glandiceps talaboti]